MTIRPNNLDSSAITIKSRRIWGSPLYPACVFILLLSTILYPSPAWSQQSIFNIPSADVTEKHEFFYQQQSGLRAWNPNRNWAQTHAFGYGIGHNTDIDLTVSNWVIPSSNSLSLGVGSKTNISLNRAHEINLTLGQLYPVSLQGKGRVGYYLYSHLNGRIPKLNTRLTAGGFLGDRVLFGKPAKGALLGIEQPLGKKLMLQADWFSGNHDEAFFIPGAVLTLRPNLFLSVGYAIPSSRRTHRKGGLIFELTGFTGISSKKREDEIVPEEKEKEAEVKKE